MTPEEQYIKMDKDVTEVKQKITFVEREISDIKENVNTILQLLQKVDVGLYGDSKNKHKGVIDKQIDLEDEIDDLKRQIHEIHRRNEDKEIESKTKKSLKTEAIETAKDTFKWVIKAIVIYLILKGVLGPD